MTVDLTPFTPVGPANSETDETTGDRWYYFPEYGRLMSVTTAFRSIAKSGLVVWSAQLAAAAAFNELPTVVSASRRRPCGNTYSQCRRSHDWQTTCEKCPCKVCRACVEHWLADRHKAESARRADEGSRLHNVIEWWSYHGVVRDHDGDVVPYVQAFLAFAEEYGLTPDSFLMAEATVINPADRYAGTTDGIIRFHAERSEAAAKLVARVLRAAGEYSHVKTGKALIRAVIRDKRTVDLIVDWKSREKPLKEGESPKFYPENAMQVTGYRMAPIVHIKGTDQFVPMPDTDGGLIVQLRPDGATPRLALTDDVTYGAFLHALPLSIWLAEYGSRSIGAYTFPLDLKPEPAPEAAPATVPDEDDPDQLGACPDCGAPVMECDLNGCDQRRKRYWRSEADSAFVAAVAAIPDPDSPS